MELLREARKLAVYWQLQCYRRRLPYTSITSREADKRWWESWSADSMYREFAEALAEVQLGTAI